MLDLVKEGYSLSAAQAAIWFAQARDADTAAYAIGEYLEIFGPVNPAVFEASLRTVVAQIDALNVTFVETASGPRQVPAREANWSLNFIDLAAAADPRAAAWAVMQSDLVKLGRERASRLFSFMLLRIAEDRFWWLHAYHHIAMDGYGVARITALVASEYNRRVDRAPEQTFIKPDAYLRLLQEDSDYASSTAKEEDRRFGMTISMDGHHSTLAIVSNSNLSAT
jgi:hypothetical protein